ncbi:MAG: ATP-binding cassette domain-containing protein [Ruminococcaceae bacterium]|nr:ATP-binding cassette domain-containing protein [Oscillospiraceae bacterium]
MELIKADKLVLSYDGKAVIDGLSFTVNEGDYIAVVGENGSGKSTLMKAITGELKPVSGMLERCAELKKYGVGYLPQQSAIQKDFPASVYEAVLSGNIRRSSFGFGWNRESKDRADEYIHLLGICKLKSRSFQELSGGQRQRVLLARAMCASDKLLLLDEPITGLDEGAAEDMYRAIRLVNDNGTAVIMVSHDRKRAEDEADRVIQLK